MKIERKKSYYEVKQKKNKYGVLGGQKKKINQELFRKNIIYKYYWKN